MMKIISQFAALTLAILTGHCLLNAAERPADIEAALARAGDNRPQLERALDDVPADQQEGLQFLVRHMPDRDLRSLSADFLLENVSFAYRARDEAAWKDRVPKEIFFNDVLPYASINERRDNWRKDFFERFRDLVKDARSPTEAAVILNKQVFPLVDVRYSTGRPKPDQSPYESIAAKTASCTGLSVLLIDACRAVGVPARFVGTPLWSNKSGNHSWVEIWDDGWHFTGACEPTGDDLDRAWFAARAAEAQRDHPLHAIYATSFQRTPLKFPLVWDHGNGDVHAVNVTDRYVTQDESGGPIESLQTHLELDPAQRPPLANQHFATAALSREEAVRARTLLWEDHVQQIRRTRAAEMQARQLTDGELKMPFFYKIFGDKPAGGRSLYISMHGGGGAPPQVNDQQWENQKRLYQLDEGVYVAPRAPTNTWNLWHQDHIDRLFDRLIEDMIVFEDVDPNRVYILGYSAGGDGVYQLAPRMADRLAAAAMMAGHPNETSPLGLRNLPFTIHVGGRDAGYNRNQVAAEWATKLAELHQADPGGYVHLVKIYPDKGHWLDREDAAAIPWMAKFTRNPLPDRIVWKQDDVTHTRFYWLAVEPDRFRGRAEIMANLNGQRIDVEAKDVDSVIVRFNDDLLDLDQPVTVAAQGKPLYEGSVPRTIAVLAKTLDERGDPKSIFSGEVKVDLPRAAEP